MKRSRKILSIVLAVLMLMSTMAMNFGASAANLEASKELSVGESGQLQRQPLTGYRCSNCRNVAVEYIPDPDDYKNVRISVSKQGIISTPTYTTNAAYGENGLPCLQVNYNALAVGSVDVTITFDYGFYYGYEEGYCDFCGQHLYHGSNYNTYTDTITLHVTVKENPTAKTYTVIYKDGYDGRVFGDETHGNLAAGAATPPCASSTNRPGYTFMGWSPALNSTVDPDMANANGEIVYTATWQKNAAQDTKYKTIREFYIDGVKIASSANSNNSGKVGDVIVGSNVFASKTTYGVDGNVVSFDFDHSNPASITLVADAASNVITAIYNHKHVDANNDGVCDECDKNNCPHTDVSYTDNGDGTHNGECDKCHETVVVNQGHTDSNGDYHCDKCGANMCPGHVDNDGDGKCDNCGDATGVHSHVWGNWVDDNNGTTHTRHCTGANCGASETENHNWTLIDSKAATCTEDGYKTYKCNDCGAEKTETVEATGHNWSNWEKKDDVDHVRHCTNVGCDATETANHNWDDGIVTTAATCGKDGVKTYTCKDCGATKTETIPATGEHVWGNWVDDENDTTHTRECANCDATQTANHNWDDGVVTTAATCGKDGVKTYTCKDCGATKTEKIPATGEHVWDNGVVTKNPTCTENGEKTYTCTVCGATKTEVIPATGHKDANNDHYCDNCGAKISDCKDENNDGKCDICGKDLGTKPTDPTDPTDPSDDPNHKHTDKDGDGICDDCGQEFHCDCICHRHGKIWKVFFKIYKVFWKLFGINPVCKCGRYHWVR